MKVSKNMKKIGLVIVNYNDAKTTIRLLKQLKGFQNIDSIIVVDNNSTDDSYNQLKEQEKGNPIPTAFVLHGAGWGHGVGLCQIGAAVMSTQGYDYRQILSHYFPNTTLEKHY